MDAFSSYIADFKKILLETSDQERSKIWNEVIALGISGPTLSEYLSTVQESFTSFNESFTYSSDSCDDFTYAHLFKKNVGYVDMDCELLVDERKIEFKNQLADSYASAA